MPELGKYAVIVLWAYGATLLLIAVLVVISLWQSARTRARLQDIEGRARE